MKKIKMLFFILIILYGLVLLIGNWSFFKEIPSEIFDKIYRSDYERSLEQDNIKIENDPNNPWSYIYRGSTFKKNKKYNEALQDYLKAYDLNKNLFMVLDAISNLYLATENTEKAYEYIFKMMKKAPYGENSLFDLAIIYDYEWRSKEAISTYGRYIKLNNMEEVKDKYLFSLKRRTVHYFLLKEYDKAKKDIETSLEINPNDEDIKALKDLLSNTNDIDNLIIQKKFKLNVYEAIVGISEI